MVFFRPTFLQNRSTCILPDNLITSESFVYILPNSELHAVYVRDDMKIKRDIQMELFKSSNMIFSCFPVFPVSLTCQSYASGNILIIRS